MDKACIKSCAWKTRTKLQVSTEHIPHMECLCNSALHMVATIVFCRGVTLISMQTQVTHNHEYYMVLLPHKTTAMH